jgi:hypothetical protein
LLNTEGHPNEHLRLDTTNLGGSGHVAKWLYWRAEAQLRRSAGQMPRLRAKGGEEMKTLGKVFDAIGYLFLFLMGWSIGDKNWTMVSLFAIFALMFLTNAYLAKKLGERR